MPSTVERSPSNSNPVSALFIENVRIYLQIKNAIDQVDPEIRRTLDELSAIYMAPNATSDEKDAALLTIIEAIFPSMAADVHRDCEQVGRSPEATEERQRMERQQEVFAARVEALLHERSLTQEAFAQLVGVRQPAISAMLTRKCRPQRRTIIRIADALGVSPTDIWPGYGE